MNYICSSYINKISVPFCSDKTQKNYRLLFNGSMPLCSQNSTKPDLATWFSQFKYFQDLSSQVNWGI